MKTKPVEEKKTTPVVAEEAEIKMVLTTPFCPYGPMLINQIQSVSETAAEMPVKVTVLPDRWEAPPWLR
jgi:metal-sulfur cluster biosynthetic enzyme